MPKKAHLYIDEAHPTLLYISPSQQGGTSIQKEDNGKYYFYNLGMGRDYYRAKEPVGFCYYPAYGLLSDFIYITEPQGEVEVTDHTVNKNENGTAAITFTFADDIWDKFENIELNVRYPRYKYEQGIGWVDRDDNVDSIIIPRGDGKKLTYTYSRDSNYFYSNYDHIYKFIYDTEIEFWFRGISESFYPSFGEEPYKITPLDEAEYDDLPPKVKIKAEKFDYVTFELYDEGENPSGPKNGYVTIRKNNRDDKYYFSETNGKYITEVPLYEFINTMTKENNKEILHYTYTAADKNGNEVKDCIGTFSFEWSYPTSIGEIKVAEKKVYFDNRGTEDILELYVMNVGSYAWNKLETEREYADFKTWLNVVNDSDEDALKDKFLRVCLEDSGRCYWHYFGYKYSGIQNTRVYDYLIPNGNSKETYLVCSDAPVYIHHLVTAVDYNICKNWKEDKWCLYAHDEGGKCFNFSPEEHSPKVYRLADAGYRPSEGECYVTIVHFADGSKIMTDVMQK